jgi:hypothetical protein
VLAFIAAQINFSALVGQDNQFFTLFQFMAPITALFLGPVVGALAVLLSEVANYVLLGRTFDLINILRLTPMMFAAYYIGTVARQNKTRYVLIVPLLAMLAFVLHPVGQQVWYFSLFWLIPVIAAMFFSQNILGKALGATFTAHAVGGAFWIWTIPMTAAQWQGLIQVVAFERVMFAAGIVVSYVVLNTLLDKVTSVSKAPEITINPKYVLGKAQVS